MDPRLTAQRDLFVTFAQCLVNALQTCVDLLPDGTTFVASGDIPAMWLRDSSAQVNPYVPLAHADPDLRRLLRGLIQRQARCVLLDPYANAFNRAPTGHNTMGDRPAPSPWVWERKFELDSLCYPLKLCHGYWRATRDRSAFDDTVHRMLRVIVDTMRVEQRHGERSPYRFQRAHPRDPADTLPYGGAGAPVAYTGMVWSGFRPSDDACRYGYHIPDNMFAVAALGMLVELAREVYHDGALAAQAAALREQIDQGIRTYGLVTHLTVGHVFVYETDGLGHYCLIDDANVPSLLSIPYLGYLPESDPIYQHTRRFVLSSANPYYFAGGYARGVGSPHTPHGYVWPLALTMCGITSLDQDEREAMLGMLLATTAGTHYMHESFDPDQPTRFTRSWFSWANSLFAEFVLRLFNAEV
jgi:meiotically up-regulated gene 157 (Mug157) protein